MTLKVLNLTTEDFTKEEIDLLSKGKTFTTIPNQCSPAFSLELFDNIRRLRFRHFFEHSNNSRKPNSPFIELISSGSSPSASSDVNFEFSAKILETCVVQNCANLPSYSTYSCNKIVSNLQRRKLHYCYADKGGTLIIMQKSDYEKLVFSHLLDSNTYEELATSFDDVTHQKIVDIVNSNTEVFAKDEQSYFINHNFQSSNFYVIPKIHKSTTIKNHCSNLKSSYLKLGEVPNDVSSRPIVSNINSPTCRISHFLDKVLQPMLPLTDGYIKDTFHFLNRLPKNVTKTTIFVSLDVVNLYTVIPHEFGIEAIHYWMTKFSTHTRNLPWNIVESFLRIILQKNTFRYKNKNYIQKIGTAMGTKVAPAYAHLVMSFLEIKLFELCSNIFGQENTNSIRQHYYRYLDDIFVIWDSTYGDVHQFLNVIQNLHPSFTFTYEMNPYALHFLDVLVQQINGIIQTDIYFKPTDSRQYLHFSSYHPSHIKRNIPYNLSYRIYHIVSNPELRTRRLNDLQNILLNLKYPAALVSDAIKKYSNGTPHQPNRKLTSNIFPVTFTYNNNNVKMFNSKIRNNVQCCVESHLTGTKKIVNAMKQPLPLIRLLRKPLFYRTEKCGNKLCKTCQHLIPQVDVTTLNGTQIKLNANMNCNSQCVIYVIQCKICLQSYVGETGNILRHRITVHRQQITHVHYSILKVSSHLRSCGGSFNLFPIYYVVGDYLRKKQEEFFIELLKPELNA